MKMTIEPVSAFSSLDVLVAMDEDPEMIGDH